MTAKFEEERAWNIRQLGASAALRSASVQWITDVSRHKYSYNFSWMGRPIIQFPQDIIAIQEIIWRVRPDLIIETGIAHGGSLVFSASMLELLGGSGHVIGIDIDIREPNRRAIEQHPMAKRITLMEGSSVDKAIINRVRELTSVKKSVLVLLDSNHTHDHVIAELRLYSDLVTRGSYLIVFDTIIEYMPDGFFADRPWGRGNNPLTAVRQFLHETDRFEVDSDIPKKLLITVAPDGYLRCLKD